MLYRLYSRRLYVYFKQGAQLVNVCIVYTVYTAGDVCILYKGNPTEVCMYRLYRLHSRPVYVSFYTDTCSIKGECLYI